MAQLATQTAIEFDGPCHYLTSGGCRPQLNGSTALKKRLLAKLGWRVLNVPYFEWDPLRTASERAGYLKLLLSQIS